MKIDADGSFSDGLRTNVLPARDRGREHPHRDHRREVERRDAGDDAERLADLVDVDAGGDLLQKPPLSRLGMPRRELEVLDAAGDLAERVGGDLAVLGGQVGGEARGGVASTRFRILNMMSVRFESEVARHRRERGLGRGDGRVRPPRPRRSRRGV